MESPLLHAIEHTLLRPEATLADIDRLCREAKAVGCFGVCINPRYVDRAREELIGSSVSLVTVVGFPLGASLSLIKRTEAVQAVSAGAAEIDMVMAIGDLKSGRLREVETDIRAVVEAVAPAPVKVILETALLKVDEKKAAAECALQAGAAFLKTSTGFFGGATVEDVRLLSEIAAGRAHVKASGGIRDEASARALLAAGATRIGTSATLAILGRSGESI